MNLDCLLCQVAKHKISAPVRYEDEDFIVIDDKYPRAPVHVLVIPKKHNEKKDTISGAVPAFWDSLISVSYKVLRKLNLDKTGYVLRNNGAGYNHFEHEHLHILGGSEKEPMS